MRDEHMIDKSEIHLSGKYTGVKVKWLGAQWWCAFAVHYTGHGWWWWWAESIYMIKKQIKGGIRANEQIYIIAMKVTRGYKKKHNISYKCKYYEYIHLNQILYWKLYYYKFSFIIGWFFALLFGRKIRKWPVSKIHQHYCAFWSKKERWRRYHCGKQ